MAQGSYYTRQQLNQIQQGRIREQSARTAAARAEQERKANDPTLKELNRLIAEKKAYNEYYEAYIAQNPSSAEALRERISDRNRRFDEKIRTAQRAASKGITVQDQRSRESTRRVTNTAKNQERQLVSRFGRDVYNEMSPEARATAYQQFFGSGFVPTPNTAAAKDAYNIQQEKITRANKRIDQINESTQATYDEINANWLGSTAGEYFAFKRTGVDPRKPDPRAPKRSDFQSTAAYNYATNQFYGRTNPNNRINTGNTGTSGGAVRTAFVAGITADRATADFMGLSERNTGAANLAYAAGQIAYIPARYYAARASFGLTGAAFKAGYGSSSLVFGEGAAATIPNVLAGGVAAYIPFQASVNAYSYVSDTPVRRRVELTTGVPYKEFRSSVVAGVEASGGLQELGAGFGFDKPFQASFRRDLSEKGYFVSGNLISAAYDQRQRLTVQEWFSYGLAGGVANVAGATAAAPLGVGTATKYPFLRGVAAIGQAGAFVEAPYSSVSQNILRGQPIDRKRLAYSVPFGGATAGVLGGLINMNYVRGASSSANFWENVGFAGDPTEFISDAGTGISSTVTGRPFPVLANPLFGVGDFSTSAPSSLSSSQGGGRPVTPPASRSRAVNPFVNPLPEINQLTSTKPQPAPFVDPNPLVGVPVSSNPNPNVPVTPNPFVPVTPFPNVPVTPNPVVPSETNPLVDVPVSKLPLWGLGAGQRLRGRSKRSFGVGFSKARYAPSFAALELGISASRINTNRTFSGLEIRPFLAPQAKKRKKAKRTKAKKRRSKAPLFSLGLGGSPI